MCFLFRVILSKQTCRRPKRIFNLDNSTQTLESFIISGAEDPQKSPGKKKYAPQQVQRNLVEKLDNISPEMLDDISREMLDDTEEKLKVAENKLNELEDDIKLFNNTWNNLLNKDEEMVEGFTDDFGPLNSETAKIKMRSGNSKQTNR